MDCNCCGKDENGFWLKEPCCNFGRCESDGSLGMCIHCGAEMFQENGLWFHHSQENIPLEQRKPHY